MNLRPAVWILIVLLIVLVVVLAMRSGDMATGTLDAGDWGRLVGLSVLATVYGATMMGMFRGRGGEALQAALAWLAIVAVLAVGYTYRYEFEAVGRRVFGNLVPSLGQEGVTGSREVTIARGPGGTYAARVAVNGARAVPMLVDTGASALVLTDTDARRAGIRVDELDFSVPVQTANGQAMTASTTVESVSVGPITERNIRTLVARPGALSSSLLGHTFLDRLESYEVRGGRMVLRGRN
jgi:aspartyl protease family protein